MAKLICSMATSLDGYVADKTGAFDWSRPDDQTHQFINDTYRDIGTYLYGRRMYEMLVFWETADDVPDLAPVHRDWARIWRAADKVVYSKTLEAVSSERTRLERNFDPEAIRDLKSTAERDIGIAGPNLAAHAIRAGLVDEYHLLVWPVVVGGGTRFFPSNVRLDLEPLTEHRFESGASYQRYRAKP